MGNIIDAINKVVDLYRTFGTLIGLIGVVVATLFTTTVLLMSVDDRRQEIALLRALGFSRPTIAGYVDADACSARPRRALLRAEIRSSRSRCVAVASTRAVRARRFTTPRATR